MQTKSAQVWPIERSTLRPLEGYVFSTWDRGQDWTEWEYRTEYDTSVLTEVVAGSRERRQHRHPLMGLNVPQFDSCRSDK